MSIEYKMKGNVSFKIKPADLKIPCKTNFVWFHVYNSDGEVYLPFYVDKLDRRLYKSYFKFKTRYVEPTGKILQNKRM